MTHTEAIAQLTERLEVIHKEGWDEMLADYRESIEMAIEALKATEPHEPQTRTFISQFDGQTIKCTYCPACGVAIKTEVLHG